MSITIYTYSNPYKLPSEDYWASIQGSFQLCVSQTMVNGLCDRYAGEGFYPGKLTTVKRFMNHLFDNWDTANRAIEKRAAIDNLINSMDFSLCVSPDYNQEVLKKSLRRNRAAITDSISEMFELNVNPSDIRDASLKDPQRCIAAMYRELIRTDNDAFSLHTENIDEQTINDSIDATITEVMQGQSDYSEKKLQKALQEINKDTVVIHGVHQFSSLMLRMIEILGKYKNVMLIFNYVPEYSAVYNTWLNVYGAFESKIHYSNYDFGREDTESCMWADQIAAIVDGRTTEVKRLAKPIEVTEFDNPTEFSGYVAKLFEDASRRRNAVPKENVNYRGTLYYMTEQIYAANSDVNDILRVYFPKQFGEREFLDYPIGHFFLSIVDMWDPDTLGMRIQDLNDIYECLSCGIIAEKNAGSLASTFQKERLFLENETTIDGMIRHLQSLDYEISDHEEDDDDDDEEWAVAEHVESYHVTSEDLGELIRGLKDLNEIAQYFFKDFNDQKNDFRTFYNKVKKLLKDQLDTNENLNAELRSIIERLLIQLDEVKDVHANASFDCLRETMEVYLQQIPEQGKGANWIVRDFQQIDGDLLRKNDGNIHKVLHLACLSDEDMSLSTKDDYPWPLTMDFFEHAIDPVDWKFQVYVNSKQEKKNFRRYALIYAMAFSHLPVKLSYVKHRRGEDCELFYLLKLMHAVIVPYHHKEDMIPAKNTSNIKLEKTPDYGTFTDQDYFRYKICNFRFLLSTVVENGSVYKDDFLIQRYFRILLQNRAKKKYEGTPYIQDQVRKYLWSEMNKIRSKCDFLTDAQCMDIVKQAQNGIEFEHRNQYRWNFKKLTYEEARKMQIEEEFLLVPHKEEMGADGVFKNVTRAEVDDTLNKQKLVKELYFARYTEEFCQYCSEKEICLESYRYKRGKLHDE